MPWLKCIFFHCGLVGRLYLLFLFFIFRKIIWENLVFSLVGVFDMLLYKRTKKQPMLKNLGAEELHSC